MITAHSTMECLLLVCRGGTSEVCTIGVVSARRLCSECAGMLGRVDLLMLPLLNRRFRLDPLGRIYKKNYSYNGTCLYGVKDIGNKLYFILEVIC